MTFDNLIKLYSDNSCQKLYVKKLSPNDNSKNQVYLGGSFDVLNILPIKEVKAEDPGDWKRARFKTKIDFYWLTEETTLNYAPDAQLILYPKYPEVRFSGFLKGVENAPSDLMASRKPGRLLFFGVTNNGQIIGYATDEESLIAKEFNSLPNLEMIGVFYELTIFNGLIQSDAKKQLIEQLKRIHSLGWINSKRLDATKTVLPCISSNCGGYTLEAELGVTPNGYAEPDFLGWEIKQFGVKKFIKFQTSVVTLMTPEPTHGFYVDFGVEAFIRKYGYKDKLGREARLNFGGIHKYENVQQTTKLKLIINGFDSSLNKITNTDGFIGLLDSDQNIAASWSFTSLLKHWNTKHSNACYVPSLNRKISGDNFINQQYYYGNKIMLGSKTDFSLFLNQIANGKIYYDPGIKLELELAGVRKQNIKRRSQFRILSGNLINLYKHNEIVDVNTID